MMDEQDKLPLLTASVVSAYVGAHSVAIDALPALITNVYDALSQAGSPDPASAPGEPIIKLTPQQIRKSIEPDALISFIDNRPYRTLKRHLRRHGLTVEAYKARYGLPTDYPTSAPTYSAARSALAKAHGLGIGGRKRKTR